ncbi:MAG: hypothetical protein R3Y49_05730, partial [Rikenellaceae bacterium]
LTINLPYAHIVFNGEAKTVTESASGSTFVVAEGASIGTLNVNAGNVEIYGSVDEILFKEGNTDSFINLWTVYTDEQFTKAIAAFEAGRLNSIALGADITISSTLNINNALAIDGGNNSLTMSGNYLYFNCNANLSLSNITVEHTTKYVIYVPADSKATEFNIENSDLSGYASIYTDGNNATFNITNSTLTGKNLSTSTFATICVGSGATGNTLNIEGTTINTIQTIAWGYEYAIDVRENTASTTVNLSNGTNFYYQSNDIRSEGRYYFIEHKVNNELRSTFTRDASITVSSDMTDKNISLASGLLFGKGTEASPYEIYDNFDLKVLPYYTDYDLYNEDDRTFAYFKQMADIEYSHISTSYSSVYPSPFSTFTPSTTTTSSTTSRMLAENFYGVYDGNGYAIHNWGYNSTATGANWGADQSIGLFANVYCPSVIKDLTLTCDAGREGILTTENCQTKNVLAVGAFAGNLAGVIENCVNNLPITIYSTEATCRVGGIYGKPIYSSLDGVNRDCAEALGCTNNGDILLTNQGSAAGILGGALLYNWTGVAVIANCTVNGNVTAPYAYEFYVDPTGTYYLFDNGGNVCNGTVTSTADTE